MATANIPNSEVTTGTANNVLVEKRTVTIIHDKPGNQTLAHWQSYILYGVCAALIALNVLIIIENGNHHASILTSFQVVIALVASVMAIVTVVGLVLSHQWPLFKAYSTAGIITILHFFIWLAVLILYIVSKRKQRDMNVTLNLVIFETLTLVCYIVCVVLLRCTLKRIDPLFALKHV